MLSQVNTAVTCHSTTTQCIGRFLRCDLLSKRNSSPRARSFCAQTTWLWVKNRYPKPNPGKWKHGGNLWCPGFILTHHMSSHWEWQHCNALSMCRSATEPSSSPNLPGKFDPRTWHGHKHRIKNRFVMALGFASVH